MNESTQSRSPLRPEHSPESSESDSPNRRPNTQTFSATTGPHELWKLSRVGLDLDQVVEEELADYHVGRIAAEERGVDAAAYNAAEQDRAIWEEIEGGKRHRLVAIVRPRAEDAPLVIFVDDWLAPPPPPAPMSETEKTALAILKTLGPNEFFARIFFSGPYEIIRDVIDRLGTDAVRELRKLSREAEGRDL